MCACESVKICVRKVFFLSLLLPFGLKSAGGGVVDLTVFFLCCECTLL